MHTTGILLGRMTLPWSPRALYCSHLSQLQRLPRPSRWVSSILRPS